MLPNKLLSQSDVEGSILELQHLTNLSNGGCPDWSTLQSTMLTNMLQAQSAIGQTETTETALNLMLLQSLVSLQSAASPLSVSLPSTFPTCDNGLKRKLDTFVPSSNADVARFRRSQREKQRRQQLNQIFLELDNFLRKRGEHYSKPRSRTMILFSATKRLSKALNIPIPKVTDDQLARPRKRSMTTNRDNLTPSEIEKRDKKSQDERMRRETENMLVMQLAMMLQLDVFENRLVILSRTLAAISK